VKVKRTKATYIVIYGLAKYERENLVRKLKSRPFSLMVDESTDVSVSKNLAVMARYVEGVGDDKPEGDNVKVVDAFFALVEAAGGKAEALAAEIEELFKEYGVPWENCIGFGSDNCNAMQVSPYIVKNKVI
jgi:hypothetical protein